jgi:hypothetical protein
MCKSASSCSHVGEGGPVGVSSNRSWQAHDEVHDEVLVDAPPTAVAGNTNRTTLLYMLAQGISMGGWGRLQLLVWSGECYMHLPADEDFWHRQLRLSETPTGPPSSTIWPMA